MQVQILAPPLTSNMALGDSLELPDAQVPKGSNSIGAAEKSK